MATKTRDVDGAYVRLGRAWDKLKADPSDIDAQEFFAAALESFTSRWANWCKAPAAK